MRILPALTFSLAAILALPAQAEIRSVKQGGPAKSVTVIYGTAPGCGSGAKIIRAGSDTVNPQCVHKEKPVLRSAITVNIVVLAPHRHRHYIRFD